MSAKDIKFGSEARNAMALMMIVFSIFSAETDIKNFKI